MKKSVIAALIFLFAMFGAVTCFAVEYVEDDMNNLVTKTQRYDTYLSSSYFENNKSETNISTQNGEFSYRQTDYSLPGRNGLDLKIERMYRGNMTSLYEIGTKFTGSEWINVIETEWSDDNYLSFYEKRYNLGAGLRFSFPTIEAVKTSENAKKYLYLHSESGDVYRMVGPKETNGTKEYKLVGYELDDIKLIEDDETNPRYNINGWKSKYIFIDRNGTKTYFSDKKAYTSKPEDYEGCILGIVDRYGNEIKFEYTELSYTVGQHTQDQHTQKKYVITKIIDTVGREVNITYLQNEDYQVTLVDENHSDGDLKGNFNVKIKTPDNQMIVYDKSNLLFDSTTKRTLRERIHAVYKLSDANDYSSTNYGILQYWFWFEKADNKFDYNGSNYETCPELGGTYNQWENLNFIKYPGNKAKVIKYCDGTKKLGTDGSMTYRKVSEETDVLLSNYTADSQDNEVTYTGTEVKKQTYAYTNEPDGYRQWSNFLLYPRLTFEEGTTDQSKFTYSGNRTWYSTTDAAADGLRSLSNNSTYPAYLEFHLPETGLISFDYKVVPRADDAKFTVNYEDRDWTFSLLQQTEECDWKHFEYFLPEGPYYRLGFHMYSGTVYLDNVSVSTYYSTTVTQEDGTYTTYLYDGLHRLVNTVEKGAGHSITTRREYNDDMLPKRIESIQSCMENGAVKGVPITQIEEFEYDGFGNLLRHIPDAPRDAAGHLSTPVYTVGDTSFQPGETVFQYDTEKYHKVTGRISASDENTILKTEYILDEMGNTIQEKRLHTEDGVSKNVITSLAYDSYGNIISKSVGGEDDTQPVTTYYDYEAAEGGADGLYLTREYMGTDYTRIKRYFYNFNNGLLTTSIEFNEPTGPMTTEYHYDYKCRLSWVKYPDKSTTSYLYFENGYDDGDGRDTNNMAINVYDSDYHDIYYVYNIFGDLLKVVNVGDKCCLKQYEYNFDGTLAKETDGLGNHTKYKYNSMRELVKRERFAASQQAEELPQEEVQIEYNNDAAKLGYQLLSDVKQVANAAHFNLALKNDGTVWSWGQNINGVLGYEADGNIQRSPKQIQGLSGIDKVVISKNTNAEHITCFAIGTNGSVWSWGDNSYGQLGTGDNSVYAAVPAQISNLSVSDLQASETFVCALLSDKTVKAWGENPDGRLGNGTTEGANVPVSVNGLSNIQSVSLGVNHGMALDEDGYCWLWGSNERGQLGTGSTNGRLTPYKNSITDISFIHAGVNQESFVCKSNGLLYGWGNNTSYKIKYNSSVPSYYTSAESIRKFNTPIKCISDDNRMVIATTETGTIYTWGSNRGYIMGTDSVPYALPEVIFSGATEGLNSQGFAGYALKNDGTVWNWGTNNQRTSGHGSLVGYLEPTQMEGLSDIVQLCVNSDTKLALRSDGTVFGWQDNLYGTIDESAQMAECYFPMPISVINPDIQANVNYRYSKTKTDEEGYKSTNYYDKIGRLVSQESSPDNETFYMTKIEYDLAGNVIKDTDAKGNQTTYLYDDLGRLIETKDALNNTTSIRYNAQGQPTEKYEPDGKLTKYSYNAEGAVEYIITGLTDTISQKYYYQYFQEYDESGNLTKFNQGHTEAGDGGRIIDSRTLYKYDSRNRLSQKLDLVEGSSYITTVYTYDSAGNPKMESLTNINGNITTHYSYDLLWRNTAKTVTANYNTQNVGTSKTEYEYDANNNVTKAKNYISETEYLVTNHIYDYANRLIEKKEPVGTGSAQRTTQFEYDKRGNLTKKTLVFGSENLSASYTYDGRGLVLAATDSMGSTSRYAYDENKNKTMETDGRYASLELAAAPGTHYLYDALNRLIRTEYFDGENSMPIQTNTYDGRGNITGITTGDSLVASESVYDAENNLVQYTTADVAAQGKTNIGQTMTYDGMGRMLSKTQYFSPTQSGTTLYTYYGNGPLKSVKYPDSEVLETYTYDMTGKLYQEKHDRNGGITKIFLSLYGDPYRTEFPDGTTETTEYDWYTGLILAYIDRKNRKTKYKYDNAKNLLEESKCYEVNDDNSIWKTSKVSYDEWDNPISKELLKTEMDSTGSSVISETSLSPAETYFYDNAFRITKIVDETMREQQFSYDAAGNLTCQKTRVTTDFDIVEYTYDARNRIVETRTYVNQGHLIDEGEAAPDHPEMKASSIYYAYDGVNLLKTTDSYGNQTMYEYDAAQHLTKTVRPGRDNTTTYQYDFAGNMTQTAVRDCTTTNYTYDTMGRMSAMTKLSPNGGTMTWKKTYDLMGNVSGEATPALSSLGQWYGYTYDNMNRRTSVMNADGDVLEAYAYDAAGNVVKKVNAKNGAGSQDISLLTGEEYTYDNYDNLISTKDYLGNTTTFEYDLKGNLTAATDAKNQKTQYAYYSDNTLARVDFPNGGYSIYTYDLKGRKTGETIAQSATKELTQSYTYTAFDKVSSVTDADGKTISYRYDKNCNLRQATDKRGNTVVYTYDANNLLIETKTPFDTVGDEIRYQVIALEYDTEGKVTKQTTSGGGAQQRITSYMYDNGLIVNTVNNAGQETVYEYDDAGRVVRTKVLRNEENGNKIYDITEKAYDKYDRVTEERGFLDQATVDAGLGALTLSESGQVVAKTTYRYDVMGNLTQLQSPMAFVDTANQTLYTTDYSYDNQSRLTQVSTYYQGGGEPQQITTNYAYDAVGNRVSVTDAKGNVTGYTYDTLNRVSSVTNANNMTTSYTYDLAGNKISETKPSGTWNYEYDSLNRLVVTRNPDGDVVGKVVYDENGNVTKRIDGNGTCLAQMTSLGMELNTSITSQI